MAITMISSRPSFRSSSITAGTSVLCPAASDEAKFFKGIEKSYWGLFMEN